MRKIKALLIALCVCATVGAFSSCDFFGNLISKGSSSNQETSSSVNMEEYSKGLEYELNEDGASYSVKGIGTYTDTELVIPSKYEGLPVTSIGDSAFHVCTSLTSVEIPDSVTSIGSDAFYYCTSLTSVVIGDSVRSIGNAAFYDCASLTSVEIPD